MSNQAQVPAFMLRGLSETCEFAQAVLAKQQLLARPPDGPARALRRLEQRNDARLQEVRPRRGTRLL